MIRQDPKSAELIKPVLRGKDINRYQANWCDLWLIDTHNGYQNVPPVNVDRYKSIKRHLDKFYPELERRQDRGVTPYNLRNCAYHEEFEGEKIVWTDISTSPTFTLLPNNFYINNTAYLVNSDSRYLLGILNSDVAKYYMSLIATELGKKGCRYFKQFVEQLPVPQVWESEQVAIAKIVEIMLQRKRSNPFADTSDLECRVNRLVFNIYKLEEEEQAIVLG